jgi:hypothetical protein
MIFVVQFVSVGRMQLFLISFVIFDDIPDVVLSGFPLTFVVCSSHIRW